MPNSVRSEHPVEFSDWKGDPLFTCKDVALSLNRMLRVTNNLLCQFQSARKILPSGNHRSQDNPSWEAAAETLQNLHNRPQK